MWLFFSYSILSHEVVWFVILIILALQEQYILGFDREWGLGPAGWLSRHPFFYEYYDISSSTKERRFKSFYDFMISEDTYFFGIYSRPRTDHMEYYQTKLQDNQEYYFDWDNPDWETFMSVIQIKVIDRPDSTSSIP